MRYILILRHGRTHHNQLIVEDLKQYIHQLTDFIHSYGPIETVYASPLDRCFDTAQWVMSYLEAKHFYINPNLRRIDAEQPGEEIKRRGRHRGQKIGEKIRTKALTSHGNTLIITHSSLIRSVIDGIAGVEPEWEYLHDCSLSVFNLDTFKLEVWNKGWKSP